VRSTPLLSACLAFVSACGGSSRPAGTPASSASPLLGQEAPRFTRTALDGSTFDLGRSHGTVTVVTFLAKQCDLCTRTLPAVEALHEDTKDLVVVGVAEDEKESDAREAALQSRLSFPVVHDPAKTVAATFHVSELPVTFVLDGGGRVKWVGGPEKHESELRPVVEALMR
jgi:cytochrome c biogenesis protein CcmG/thiol:disulfide interchange protein DsbE